MSGRIIEILRVLADAGATWDCCSGPNGEGILDSDLLLLLQSRYPSSGWTLSFLQGLLLTSRRQGRIKENKSGGQYVNLLMESVNVANSVYAQALGIRNCVKQNTPVCISGDGHYSQMS